MSTTNEVLWQKEVDHRKRIRRGILIVGLLAAGLLVAVWAMVTQPLSSNPPVRNDLPAVSPSNLESHVRVIAEKMYPRDAGHPQNLDRTAAYIRQSFENAHATVTEQPFEVDG